MLKIRKIDQKLQKHVEKDIKINHKNTKKIIENRVKNCKKCREFIRNNETRVKIDLAFENLAKKLTEMREKCIELYKKY